MHLAFIVGARPNFMKVAPILRATETCPDISTTLIHTGQHYDHNLSDIFFDELGVRSPDLFLGIGSGSHGEQTGKLLIELEKAFVELRDRRGLERVVVVGDVNSTLAATLAAVKLHIPVTHVEAGLRSFDRQMPEEINRLLTDSVCDMLLVSEPAGVDNLIREGHAEEHIHLVGNVMIDTLFKQVAQARERDTLQRFGLQSGQFATVTLHRPSNVDDPGVLSALIDVLVEIAAKLPIIFPIHPRTRKQLTEFNLLAKLECTPQLICTDPLGYQDFLCLTSQSKVIVTDSGGLQEESTALLVPCLTMRVNTERPITVSQGTSTLIGNDASKLKSCLEQVIRGEYKRGTCPELWDGQAAERIVEVIAQFQPC